jgi:hypothetical protein
MRTVLESIVVVSVLAALSSVELLMLKGSDPQGWSMMMQRYGSSPLLGTLLANLSIPLIIILYATAIAEMVGISLIVGRIRNLRYGALGPARPRLDGSSSGLGVVPLVARLPPAPPSVPCLSLIREHPSFSASRYLLKDWPFWFQWFA